MEDMFVCHGYTWWDQPQPFINWESIDAGIYGIYYENVLKWVFSCIMKLVVEILWKSDDNNNNITHGMKEVDAFSELMDK